MATSSVEPTTAAAIDASVWRDLAQLAAEALAIGVVFSVLLALAVFMVARGSQGEEFAASRVPIPNIQARDVAG